ncbi:FecR domain-containing protein [Gimesia aquarii]|uniref:FecR protein n=1 Tax=Gimesia aquarii TaxID=2527964 RepID=A0A517WUL9_9PLAN|nr:FecR domain-containing protein [Gimesia aquarii]QDU08967.1 FecR protein [Gimesia aquarii]
MNQKNNQNEILFDLLGALCNQTITAEQHQTLENLLAEDAEARQHYFNYLELHLNLERLHDERPEAEIDFQIPTHAIQSSQTKPFTNNAFKSSQALWGLVSIVCVSIVMGMLFLVQKPIEPPQLSQPDRPTTVNKTQVAEVTQTAAIRFAEGAPFLEVGSPIEIAQEYAISQGQIQFKFNNGAEVILVGPAVFESQGAEHLAVRYGSCSVFAPEGAEGFTVETPLSNVVDFGTRFSVNVTETGNTDVQVIEGETDVRPIEVGATSKGKTKRLTKGMAQRFTTNNGVVVDEIPFDGQQYVSQLPDRIISYTTTLGPNQGAEDLTSVTVQRGGNAYQYPVEDLIGIELTHYKGKSFIARNDGIDPATDGDPATLRRHLLEQDRSLVTGVVNPFGSTKPLTRPPVMNESEDPDQPNTPGMAIRFREPVVNDHGPDIVLFDLHVIVHPTGGDTFFVTPLPFTSNRKTYQIKQFDIDLASPEAKLLEKFWLHVFNQKTGVRSLTELESAKGNGGKWHVVGAKALALGIDLSDLGVPEGETVEGLFIQDLDGDRDSVDPVFIGGFPPLEHSK